MDEPSKYILNFKDFIFYNLYKKSAIAFFTECVVEINTKY